MINDAETGLTVDQFRIQLDDLLKSIRNSYENIKDYSPDDVNIPDHICDQMKIWNRNVFMREKDITEMLWILFQSNCERWYHYYCYHLSV